MAHYTELPKKGILITMWKDHISCELIFMTCYTASNTILNRNEYKEG